MSLNSYVTLYHAAVSFIEEGVQIQFKFVGHPFFKVFDQNGTILREWND